MFEDDKVSKTTVEAHMAHAQFLDSAKFITAGMVEVFLDSGRAAAIPDKIKAHLLRRGRSSVSYPSYAMPYGKMGGGGCSTRATVGFSLQG